ncbi:MAG: hypothetical protein QXV39_09140, partial [Candidatus Caldarchaeum sp.]
MNRLLESSLDTGYVVSATSNTLTANKKWGVNAWVDFVVEITEGTGEGQYRIITSNTTNTLTVSPDWDVVPDTTSKFAIRYPFIAMQNVSKVGGVTGVSVTPRDWSLDFKQLTDHLPDVRQRIDRADEIHFPDVRARLASMDTVHLPDVRGRLSSMDIVHFPDVRNKLGDMRELLSEHFPDIGSKLGDIRDEIGAKLDEVREKIAYLEQIFKWWKQYGPLMTVRPLEAYEWFGRMPIGHEGVALLSEDKDE